MDSSEPSNILVSLVISIIISAATAYYADQKGRSAIGWFIIALFISLFAPLILYFLPSLKESDSNQISSNLNASRSNEWIGPPPPPSNLSSDDEKLWYYLDQNHQQYGPVSIIALKELWDTGRLDLNSYVWSEGMNQWEKVDHLSHLKDALHKPLPLL